MRFVETITKDSLILQGLLCEPNERTREAILHIHGMGGNFFENSFIKTMISQYPKNNIAFLTVELRGSELMRWFRKKEGNEIKLQRIGNAYEIFEDSFYDIDAWVKFLKDDGYKKIHLQGHSLGPSKIAYYYNLCKEKISSLILISPSDILGLVLNNKICPEHKELLEEAKSLEKQGRKETLLSKPLWEVYTLSAKTYINFFQETSNTAIFNYHKPQLGFRTLSKIDVPILAILGTKDDGIVTDAYNSIRLLKEKAVNCPKFVGKVLEGAEHNYEGYEEEIVKIVLKFIKEI